MVSSSRTQAAKPTQNGGESAWLITRLRDAGLRPTRQRLALAKLLFDRGNHHITAEALYSEARTAGVDVSLATVYNALHTFTNKGLLREISIDSSCSYFDTNTIEHHHFYFEKSGSLRDIDQDQIKLGQLPKTPDDLDITGVDVVIRIDG